MIGYVIAFGIGFTVAVYIASVLHEIKLYKQAKEFMTKPCSHCDGLGLILNEDSIRE